MKHVGLTVLAGCATLAAIAVGEFIRENEYRTRRQDLERQFREKFQTLNTIAYNMKPGTCVYNAKKGESLLQPPPVTAITKT